MKKALSIVALLMAAVLLLVACGGAASSAAPAPSADASSAAPPADGAKPYIAVISKGFQHQFWQTVSKGASDAAAKYNVDVTFDGPPSESDVAIQVDMLNAAIAKKPAAIALAALDTDSVMSQLNDLLAAKIPVVGFDSGVPNAPAGAIVSTASTNNEAAGALGAENMIKSEGIMAAIKSGTPFTVACLSQDATSASVGGRTTGFVNKMSELLEKEFPGAVSIEGHQTWAKKVANAKATIYVGVPPTTSATDLQSLAQQTLGMKGLQGIFCTNEGTVGGVLAATADGTELDRTKGKYKTLTVCGFDAGATQKNAVKEGWFYGSVTQDPYMIGFYAVELAYKAMMGEKVETVVDTGAQFYTAANMADEKIAILLYD